MVKDNIRDQRKYFSSFKNIQIISDQGGEYLANVTTVRNNVNKIKVGMVETNLKVTKAFSLQLKKKKALYIL